MLSTGFLSIKVGDIRATNHLHNDGEKEIMLMARITGLVPEDVELLDLADYAKLQSFFRRVSGLGSIEQSNG